MQETQTLFECRKNTTIKVTAEYTIHKKVSQKHTKNENAKSATGPTWHRAGGVLKEQFWMSTTSR